MWHWPQVSCSIRHAHKTYMLSKAHFSSKSCTLFGTHRYAHIQWDWLQHLYSIRHAQYCKIALSLELSSARTKNAHVGEILHKLGTLKCTWLVRLNLSLALYSALRVACFIRDAHKTHILSKSDVKSRTLSSTHRKRTCRVRLTTSLMLYSSRTLNVHFK